MLDKGYSLSLSYLPSLSNRPIIPYWVFESLYVTFLKDRLFTILPTFIAAETAYI